MKKTTPTISRKDFLKLAGLGAGAAALSALPKTAAAAPAAALPVVPRVTPYRVGQWLPSDQAFLNRWLRELIRQVDANPKPLLPVMQEFKALIEGDPAIYMYFHQMFDDLPDTDQFKNDPMGNPQVRDYEHMLALINAILTTAPAFNKTGLVGFPINAILDWPMGTEGGYAAFLNEKVNAQIKKILNTWARFLNSPSSRYVLNEDPRTGWFGEDAMDAMPDFADTFKCSPDKPYYGFTSWDNFFTREFKDGLRPIDSPDDDSVIVNACESAPFRIAEKVQWMDKFWIKAQPYSLKHMFAGDPLGEQFIDGTIYQAFLSALSYHRWHSPISGTIIQTNVIDGTYYSENPDEGFDPSAPNDAQAYITEVATRAIILIQADDPRIGLMAFMAIGMAEVSTCDITVKVDQHVTKGDPLGMFHFGGSTHCLIFQPGVELEFDLHGQTPGLDSSNIEVLSAIARVKSA